MTAAASVHRALMARTSARLSRQHAQHRRKPMRLLFLALRRPGFCGATFSRKKKAGACVKIDDQCRRRRASKYSNDVSNGGLRAPAGGRRGELAPFPGREPHLRIDIALDTLLNGKHARSPWRGAATIGSSASSGRRATCHLNDAFLRRTKSGGGR